jgi:hypothetical protein
LRSTKVLVLLGLCCAMLPGLGQAAMQRAGGIVYPADLAGFWERFRAGNIDAPGSEAYNRWGAGFDAGIRASDSKFTRARQ